MLGVDRDDCGCQECEVAGIKEECLRNLLATYFDEVKSRVVDTVPKAIILNLVHEVQVRIAWFKL